MSTAAEIGLEKRLLTVAEMSRYAGLPKATIYTWLCLRRFPDGAVVRLGRAVRFDRVFVDAWIEAGRDRVARG
jgi:excisionase family DNA binding protein